MSIFVLPYKGENFKERRTAFFLRAFGKEALDMRIFPFGKCNYACPYCKRGGYDKEENLHIIDGAVEVSEKEFYEAVDDAIRNKEVVRLSGGDPACYPQFSYEVLKYAKEHGGITSIAHNGSSPHLAEVLSPVLDSASIDFKASSPEELAEIASIDLKNAPKLFANTIRTIQILSKNNVKTDVRTCIFNTTTYEQLNQIIQLVLQNSNPDNIFYTLRTYSPIDDFDKQAKTPEEMDELARRLSKSNPSILIGVRTKWEPLGFSYYKVGEKLEKIPQNTTKNSNDTKSEGVEK